LIETPSDALVAEIAAASADLETQAASKAIEWSLGRFGKEVVLAASFQDVVLIDLPSPSNPDRGGVPDTGAHFDETLSFVDEVSQRYDLNLTVTHPGPEADAFPCGSPRCCEFRKVAPLRGCAGGQEGVVDRSQASGRPDEGSPPPDRWRGTKVSVW